MSELMKSVAENGTFILEFLGVVVSLVVVAYIGQKIAMKKRGVKERILSAKTMAVVALFSAIAAVLMLFEMPVFFAPFFYKLDVSDVPALIGGFAMGPVAGVIIEFLKIVLKVLIKGTSTAFVGELANFVVGCSFIIPATIMYQFSKKKKVAIIACVVGTLVMTVFGSLFNGIYLLPKFSTFIMPLEDIIASGTEKNANVKDIMSFVLMIVFPLNLLKGIIMSVLTMFLYKPISKEFHKFTNS